MPILSGKRLGPYEILSAVGAGGMGEVYRAKDTHLDRIVAELQKTLELDPNFVPARNQLGNDYIHKSMYKDGIAEFEKVLAISPSNNLALSGLGHAYAVSGRKAEAQQVLDQMNGLARQKYVPASYRAAIYIG